MNQTGWAKASQLDTLPTTASPTMIPEKSRGRSRAIQPAVRPPKKAPRKRRHLLEVTVERRRVCGVKGIDAFREGMHRGGRLLQGHDHEAQHQEPGDDGDDPPQHG